MIDLAEPVVAPLVALASRVRRVAEGQAWTIDDIASAVVHLVFDELSGSLALVRAYRTRRFARLPPDLQAIARGSTSRPVRDDTRCLVLVASRGNEPAWNDVARSVRHRALALPIDPASGPASVVTALVARLDQLDRAPAGAIDAAPRVFYVPDAVGDPRLPMQREFVLRHGVRSVLGCGGPLDPGEHFALVLFATTLVPPAIAHEIDALGVHARLALLDATDHAMPATAHAQLRAQLLDTVLQLQEYRFQRHIDQERQDREAWLARTARLQQESGTQAALDAERVRRAQRAMLNVIDDLRDARDRLEHRVGERTAELAERNRELEQFAYIASHDLQEPLRTVAGYLQLIEQRYADRLDADAHDFIRFAVEGSTRMQALIEALLAYSRLTRRPPAHARVALDDVLDDVLRGLERATAEAHATIERGALPVVHGDRIQLGQLLQNLIGNALKFRGESPAHVSITAVRDGAHHVITVRDRGIGFDNRHAERIFAVFRRLQRKYPGTGIGLAICKKIVERHNGNIHASSAPGRGSTFTVTLPAEPPAPPP
ncbi:MAG TPA: ATP-binding protein [Kofleriaceae bacterium]|nr:ATP-binding protein [Kofleriaceae bacterium]